MVERCGRSALAQLIEQGLAHDAALACQAHALARRNTIATAHSVKARLNRMVAPRDGAAMRLADTYDLAQIRSRRAANIALAYIEARRWQERIALRAQALAPCATMPKSPASGARGLSRRWTAIWPMS
jgi:hypothetical protein